jgi:hypothetical protein
VVALRLNSGEGRGVPVLEHPLDGVVVLTGGGVCSSGRSWEWKGKGGWQRVCFIGDVVGSGGWVTGSTTRWRGVGGVGPEWRSSGAAWPTASRLWRSWAAHARVPHDRRQNRGGRGLTGGPRYSPRRRRFEYISN